MALTKVKGAGIGTVTNQFSDINMSAGSIIQTTELSSASDFSTTSGSFTDTTYLLSITPQFTSSKILILSTIIARVDGTATALRAGWRWVRRVGGSDTVIANTGGNFEHLQVRNGPDEISGVNGYIYVDSPSTTSAVTYVCQTYNPDTSGITAVRARQLSFGGSLTLMEIRG
tara:strand:+ start:99 stop:614 length:516 start_codon:yes stop_codon:yes gene_type:complete